MTQAEDFAALCQADSPRNKPTKPISPTSVEVLEASLKHFGPSPDGAVERDLAAAKERESHITPCRHDIRRFLDVFRALDEFEASQRMMRGYGAFKPCNLHDNSTQRVVAWLESMAI